MRTFYIGLVLIPVLSLTLLLNSGCQPNNPTNPAPTPTPVPGPYSSAPVTVMFDVYPNIQGIAYDSSQLWITSRTVTSGALGLFECSTLGVTATAVTMFNGGTTFASNNFVNAGPDGSLYVTDSPVSWTSNLGCVYVFDSTGAYQNMVSIGGILSNAVVNSAGTTLFVLSYLPQAVYTYSISGTGAGKTFSAAATFSIPQSGNGAIHYPLILAADSSSNLYVSNSEVGYAVEFGPTGNYLKTLGTSSPGQNWGLTLDGSGNIFVANSASGYIQEFDSAGNPVRSFGQGILNQPEQITLDSVGNLFVANEGLDQIIEFKK